MECHRGEGARAQFILVVQPPRHRQDVIVSGHVGIGVGDHHRLRLRRRAGGEQDFPDVIRMDRDIRILDALVRDEVVKGRIPFVRPRTDGHDRRDACRLERMAHALPKVGIDNGATGLHSLQPVRDDVRGHHHVHRCGNQPGLGDGDLRQPGLDGVVAEHGHPRRIRQTQGQQSVGDTVHQFMRLSVGDAGVLRVDGRIRRGDQAFLVRGAPRHTLEDVAHRHAVPALVVAAVAKVLDVDLDFQFRCLPGVRWSCLSRSLQDRQCVGR